MEQWIELATKLKDGGVALVLLVLLVGSILALRSMFRWGSDCQEARIKESEQLVRCIEENTSSNREQTRATEADIELQKSNKMLLEQNSRLLESIALATGNRGRRP